MLQSSERISVVESNISVYKKKKNGFTHYTNYETYYVNTGLVFTLPDGISQSTEARGMEAINYDGRDYAHMLVIMGRNYLGTMHSHTSCNVSVKLTLA